MSAKALPLAALLLAALPALAQQGREPLLIGGIVAGVDRQPYRGMDAKTRVLPLLIYENDWVSVALPTVDVKLARVGDVSLRLRSRFGFEGYEAKDSAWLAGMAERKGSLWLGAAAVLDSPLGELSFDWVADTLGHSKGNVWQLQFERRFELGDVAVTPRLGVRGVDKKYADYYYGVRPTEAVAGRPAFVGGSSRQTEVGLRLSYSLGERDMLFADMSGVKLGSAIERSPLLERRYHAGVFAGYLYRF
jgi:MipA family protein